MKKVQSYIKNIGKSMKYASIDVLKKSAPSTAELVETNGDLFKEITDMVVSRRVVMNRVSSSMKRSKVYDAANQLKTSIFEDIKSGNLYNKSRKDKIDREILGMDDFDDGFGIDDEFNFDSDFSSDDEEFNMSDGEAHISKTISENSEASAQMISSTIARTSEYVVQNQNSLFEFQMMHNVENFKNINNSLQTINDNISRVVDFNNNITSTHMQNSKTYYEETTNILKENNALLKEFVEMERNRYSAQADDSKSNVIRYKDVVSASGVPDMREYFGSIKKNINNKISSMSGGMGGDMFGEDSNILMAFVSSPLEFIPKMMVTGLMNKNLKGSISRLDKSISSFFSAVITRFNTMAKSDNPIFSTIGEIFGLNNKLDLTIETSKYNKEAVPWDGKARQALIEVIPTYLSKLVALQSGLPEKIYNYDRGKFTTATEIKKDYDKLIKSEVSSSTSDIREKMEELLTQTFSFRDIETKKSLKKDMDSFFTHFFKSGELFDYGRKSYDDYDGVISNEDNYNIIKGLFSNMPRHMQLQFYKDIMDGRDSLDSRMRRMEGEGDSIYRILNNEFGINEYFDKKGKFKDLKGPGFGDISNIKDSNGNTVFYYLKKMTSTLLEGIKVVPLTGGLNASTGNSSIDYIMNRNTGIKREPFKTTSSNINSSFIKNEEKRAIDNNLKYLEDVIGDDSSKASNIIKTNREILDIEKKIKGEKKNAITTFIDDLLDSNTLYEKFKVINGKVKKVFDSPANMISGLLDRVDMRMYEVIYGKEDREYKGRNVKGFLDMLLVDLENTFSKFNTWMDEKILTPLKDRFGGFGNRLLDGVFTGMGMNISGFNIKDKTKSFLFGKKDSEGNYIDKGIMSNLSDQLKSDIRGIKSFALGRNTNLNKIYILLANYANDPTKHNQLDQYQLVADIEYEMNAFSSSHPDDQKAHTDIKKVISSIDSENISEKLNSILTILQNNNYGGEDTSIKGILKNSFNTIKTYSVGNRNQLDKINKLLGSNNLQSRNAFYTKDNEVNGNKVIPLINLLQEYLSTTDYNKKRNILDLISDEIQGLNPHNNAELELQKSLQSIYSKELPTMSIKNPNKIAISLLERLKGLGIGNLPDKILNFYNKVGDVNKKLQISETPLSKISPSGIIPGTSEDFNMNLISRLYGLNDEFNPEDSVGVSSKENIRNILNQFTGNNVEEILSNVIGEIDSNKDTSPEKKSLLENMIYEFKNMYSSTQKVLFGTDDMEKDENKINEKFNKAFEDVTSNIREYFPKIGSGAILGAGLGILPGIIGGPLMWSAIGASTSLIKNSEKVQDYLFGDKVDGERQGGVISKDVVDGIEKYAPDMKKFGITGAALGIMPFTPVGIVGGMMLGTATAFAKNNSQVQDFLFGENGIIGKDNKEKMDKALPKLLAGGALGALGGIITTPMLGSFGLVGGTIAGAGLSFASSSDKFKEFLYGKVGEKGLLGRDGESKIKEILPKAVAGSMAVGALSPLGLLGSVTVGSALSIVTSTDHFKDTIFGKTDKDGKRSGGFVGTVKTNINSFIDTNIKKPFNSAMKPFREEIKNMGSSIKESFTSAIDKVFENSVGKPLGELVQDKIVKPFTTLFQKIFNVFGKIVGGVISSPFKAISHMSESLKIKHIKSGKDSYMTQEEKDDIIKKHPFKFLLGGKYFSKAMGSIMGFDKSSNEDDVFDEIIDEESSDINKKSLFQKLNEKITKVYTEAKNKYGSFKDRSLDSMNTGKNNVLNKIQLAALAAMHTGSKEETSSQDDEEGESRSYISTVDNAKISKLEEVLKDRDSQLESLKEQILNLTHAEDRKNSMSNIEDDSVGSKGDMKDIRNYVSIIADEVTGQLDGVGYNIETIKNVLVENLGEPVEGATGIYTSRGNKKRKGFLGSFIDFIKNPLGKAKGLGKRVLFGRDGESGLLGWVVKGVNQIKKIVLLPVKIIQEAYGVIKGAGQLLLEGVKAIGPAISGVLVAAIETVAAPIKAVGNIILEIGVGVGKAGGHLIEGIGVVGKELLKLSTIIPKTIKAIGDLGLYVGKTVLNTVKFLGSGMGNIIGAGVSFFTGKGIVKEKIVKTKIEGGFLDNIKTIDTINIVEAINDLKNVRSIPPTTSLPTEYGILQYKKDYKGDHVPVQDSVYKKHMSKIEKRDTVSNEIRDLTSKNVKETSEISDNTSILDKMKSGIGSMFGFFKSLKPLLLLAIPFIPKIIKFIKNSGIGSIVGRGLGAIGDLAFGKKEVDPETGETDRSGGLFGLVDKVVDSPTRSIANYLTSYRATPKLLRKAGSASLKAGSKATNFIKNTSIAKKVGSGISGFAKNAGNKVIDFTKSVGSKFAKTNIGSKAIKKSVSSVNKIAEIVKKIFTNSRVVSLFKKIFPKSGGKLASKLASELPGKIVKNAGDDVAKAISKGLAGFNIYLVIGFIINDITTGMTDAKNILQMTGDLPVKFRLISGLVKMINNRITFGLVPQKVIMDIIISIVGTEEEQNSIKEGRQKLIDGWKQHNEQNPDDILDFDEYNDLENKRFWNIKNWFKKKPSKKKSPAKSSTDVYNAMNMYSNRFGKGRDSDLNKLSGGLNKFPFYSQKDARWSNKPFSSPLDTAKSKIKDSGCGPTAGAMMVSGMTGKNISPVEATKYASDNNFKEPDGGTLPEFFTSFNKKYGIPSSVNRIDANTAPDIMNKLQNNIPVVLMGQSNDTKSTPFGQSPHYVLATGLQGNNIIVNDPESNIGGSVYDFSKTLGSSTLGIVPQSQSSEYNIEGEESFLLPEANNISNATSTSGGPIMELLMASEVMINSILGLPTDKSIFGNTSNEYNYSNLEVNSNLTNNEFVKLITPGALKSRDMYGILPSIIVAQAILESGWGKRAIGNNIFGIKAGSSWKGKVKRVRTHEYENGIRKNVYATFRDYDSVDDSIIDHGKLLGTKPRYIHVRNAKNYIEAAKALQKAGYATDPSYPNKLISIIQSNGLQELDKMSKLMFNPILSNMKGSVTGKTNVHSWYLDRIRSLSSAHGNKPINITSGYRSREEQRRLWNDHKRKHPHMSNKERGRWVANPDGTGSYHMLGVAADISTDWVKKLPASTLSKFGMWRPLSNEPWHFEAIETRIPGRSRSSVYSSVSAKYGTPDNPKGMLSNTGPLRGGPIMGRGKNNSTIPKIKKIDRDKYMYGTGNTNNGNTSSTNIQSQYKINNANKNRSVVTTPSINNNTLVSILIKLLTKIVDNTSNLSEILALLSEGLNINIPEEKLKNIRNSKGSTAIIAEASKESDNNELLSLIKSLESIATE